MVLMDNGEPDGIFKFSSKEIAGETGAEGHEDDPKYRTILIIIL